MCSRDIHVNLLAAQSSNQRRPFAVPDRSDWHRCSFEREVENPSQVRVEQALATLLPKVAAACQEETPNWQLLVSGKPAVSPLQGAPMLTVT